MITEVSNRREKRAEQHAIAARLFLADFQAFKLLSEKVSITRIKVDSEYFMC